MPFSTDTRTLQPGDTFVAIRGERHDGHDFVQQAFDRGASDAVTERKIAGVREDQLTIVPNTVIHLAELAHERVARARARVVAITGSVGKTTTRNAVAQVLQGAGPVVASVGNLNTLLGSSLTLVNSDLRSNACLVLEMGATKKGDLSEITTYFKPDVSIVTNVRGVHLETFGSLDGVEEAKGELVRALGPDGIACLNADDPRTRAMVAYCRGEHLFFGIAPDAQITPLDITANISLLGDHVIYVALAAFAAGRAMGMEPKVINEALCRIKPEKGRLNRLPGKSQSVLIDDTYNASPDAVKAALNVLDKHPAERRVVFLGDMLELGSVEHEEHLSALREAASIADYVYGCGPRMQLAVNELPPEIALNVRGFQSSKEIASELVRGRIYRPKRGDVILVKGSQGARMERVSRALLAEDISPESVLPRQTAAWLAI
ncbi:MAG: UDP-N-acetylmuramoyl-tripeptide--D-alanyl-D-alanine ligase [Bacteroidota bacterium]|nr:UDP-N-acetylmuramoyl-tripeptide--D-alanyl-D-alanine ligase [Bacteroidota bacterium]